MAPKTHEEIRLLEASLRGDTAAFEAIVKDYQPLVCGITYSAFGDVTESEELARQSGGSEAGRLASAVTDKDGRQTHRRPRRAGLPYE